MKRPETSELRRLRRENRQGLLVMLEMSRLLATVEGMFKVSALVKLRKQVESLARSKGIDDATIARVKRGRI